MQQGIPPPGQVPPRINGAMPNPHGPPQNRPGPLANPYMTNSMANAQHMQGMQGRPTPPGPPNFQPQQQRPGPGTGFLQQPNQAGPGQRIPAVNGGMPFDPSQAHRITPFPPPQGSGTPTPYPPLPQQQRPPSTSEELSMPQQSPRMHGAQVEAEFQKISPQSLRDLKSELNLGDKDSANLTQDDKVCSRATANVILLKRTTASVDNSKSSTSSAWWTAKPPNAECRPWTIHCATDKQAELDVTR